MTFTFHTMSLCFPVLMDDRYVGLFDFNCMLYTATFPHTNPATIMWGYLVLKSKLITPDGAIYTYSGHDGFFRVKRAI